MNTDPTYFIIHSETPPLLELISRGFDFEKPTTVEIIPFGADFQLTNTVTMFSSLETLIISPRYGEETKQPNLNKLISHGRGDKKTTLIYNTLVQSSDATVSEFYTIRFERSGKSEELKLTILNPQGAVVELKKGNKITIASLSHASVSSAIEKAKAHIATISAAKVAAPAPVTAAEEAATEAPQAAAPDEALQPVAPVAEPAPAKPAPAKEATTPTLTEGHVNKVFDKIPALQNVTPEMLSELGIVGIDRYPGTEIKFTVRWKGEVSAKRMTVQEILQKLEATKAPAVEAPEPAEEAEAGRIYIFPRTEEIAGIITDLLKDVPEGQVVLGEYNDATIEVTTSNRELQRALHKVTRQYPRIGDKVFYSDSQDEILHFIAAVEAKTQGSFKLNKHFSIGTYVDEDEIILVAVRFTHGIDESIILGAKPANVHGPIPREELAHVTFNPGFDLQVARKNLLKPAEAEAEPETPAEEPRKKHPSFHIALVREALSSIRRIKLPKINFDGLKPGLQKLLKSLKPAAKADPVFSLDQQTKTPLYKKPAVLIASALAALGLGAAVLFSGGSKEEAQKSKGNPRSTTDDTSALVTQEAPAGEPQTLVFTEAELLNPVEKPASEKPVKLTEIWIDAPNTPTESPKQTEKKDKESPLEMAFKERIERIKKMEGKPSKPAPRATPPEKKTITPKPKPTPVATTKTSGRTQEVAVEAVNTR